MTLTPSFDAEVETYTATTSNASNKITAVASDNEATVAIKVGDTTIENGASATWAKGENVVTITVTNGTAETEYTVTVTKS